MNASQETLATPAPIDEATLRRSLARLKQAPLNPREGLFGPDSMFWEVNRHALVYFLGAVQSVQMQLIHPWVGTAVFEHSKIMSAPRRRAQLTYRFLWSFIYGDLDTVTKRALGLYKVHAHVTGSLGEDSGRHKAGEHYAANEAHAMLWVHVTAFWCRVRLYEQLVRPLHEDERDRFVREAKLYAYCFGIPEDIHPENWRDVQAYVDAMMASPMLAANAPGMTIRRFLERSIPRPLRAAVWHFICQGLPARNRELLDMPAGTPANLASARRLQRLLGFLQRHLPATFAYVPAWHEAMARIAGRSGPDWLTARMNTLILGQARLVS